MMQIASLITAVVVIVDIAACACLLGTLHATTNSQSKHIIPLNNEHCTFYIRPNSLDNSISYYLEIAWVQSDFDVRGNMPYCREDYVEVFLTRNYVSIGKFCSLNALSPFTMYSRDGYARIVYHTDDNDLGNGFTFSYQLKNSTLGATPNVRSCYNTYSHEEFGMIYSAGWPSGYSNSSTPCVYQISKIPSYSSIYVIFMDISMNPHGYPNDCVEVSGHNTVSSSPIGDTTKFCQINHTATYVADTNIVQLKFNRRNGIGYNNSYRGFVAGFTMYKKSDQDFTTASLNPGTTKQRYTTAATTPGTTKQRYTTAATSPETTEQRYTTAATDPGTTHQRYTIATSNTVTARENYTKANTDSGGSKNTPDGHIDVSSTGSSTITGIVVGVLVLGIILCIIITITITILVKQRRKENADELFMPVEYVSTVMARRVQCRCQLSSPQNEHQTVTYRTVCYPQEHPAPNSCSSSQSTNATIPPVQYKFVCTPSNSTIPAEAFQPSTANNDNPETWQCTIHS